MFLKQNRLPIQFQTNYINYIPEIASYFKWLRLPVPVAARSKSQVYGRSPAGIVGSIPTDGMDVCLL